MLLVTYAPVRLIRNAATAFFFVSLSVLALPAQAEPVTLVALGDSLTAGYGLPPDQGLVPQLQSWLAAQGEAGADSVVITVRDRSDIVQLSAMIR